MIVNVKYEHLKYKEYLYDDIFVFNRVFGQQTPANYSLVSADGLTITIDVFDADALMFLATLFGTSKDILLASYSSSFGQFSIELGTGLTVRFRFVLDSHGMIRYIYWPNSAKEGMKILAEKAQSDSVEIFIRKCYEESGNDYKNSHKSWRR